MICPRDNISLIERRLNGHHFHFCERCYGIWFTADGLKKILADKNRPVIVKPGEEPWTAHSDCKNPGLCPVDSKTPMTLDNRRGVCIDVCHEHKGIWLDSGELEKMVEGLGKATKSGEHASSVAVDIVGDFFIYAAVDTTFQVALAGAEVAVEAAAEVVPGIAEAIGSIIVEIIAGLF
jgi:Zn-finger nucleic acid-binding protein